MKLHIALQCSVHGGDSALADLQAISMLSVLCGRDTGAVLGHTPLQGLCVNSLHLLSWQWTIATPLLHAMQGSVLYFLLESLGKAEDPWHCVPLPHIAKLS